MADYHFVVVTPAPGADPTNSKERGRGMETRIYKYVGQETFVDQRLEEGVVRSGSTPQLKIKSTLKCTCCVWKKPKVHKSWAL